MLNDKSIVVWISIITILGCTLLCVIPALAPDEWIYPDEVINTFEACDWCQSEECDKYYDRCPQCCGGMTCVACVGRYHSVLKQISLSFQARGQGLYDTLFL